MRKASKRPSKRGLRIEHWMWQDMTTLSLRSSQHSESLSIHGNYIIRTIHTLSYPIHLDDTLGIVFFLIIVFTF